MEYSKKSTVPIESEIADFFHVVLPTLFDLNSNQLIREFYTALKDIRQLKHDVGKSDKLFFSSIQYKKLSYRLAYIYAYGLIHSTVVYDHFSNYLDDDVSVMSRYFPEKKLRICCLGGAFGFEAVAISKVITDFFGQSENENPSFLFLDIYVTVIDIYKEWETQLTSIVEAVNKHAKLLDTKKIKLHSKFLQADLLKAFDESVKKEIEEADVVTMIKLASAISEKTPDETVPVIENMFKNVIDCMTEESSLFLLDSAGGSCFPHLVKILSKRSGASKFNKMTHIKHSLNIRDLQKVEKLINFEKRARAPPRIPTRLNTVSSCFWIKTSNQKKVKIPRMGGKISMTNVESGGSNSSDPSYTLDEQVSSNQTKTTSLENNLNGGKLVQVQLLSHKPVLSESPNENIDPGVTEAADTAGAPLPLQATVIV